MRAPILPSPRKDRWQPLRSGLVNLYRYDDEEFWYEDGHLLLRGNNGTGKSRVLALQLPFLLDGEVAPHRMEPDADPSKRVEWNLLMGRHADRQGYTWLEFGRRSPDRPDDAEYLTLGCGMAAVESRPLVSRWFFITTRRVGHDLFLISPLGHALGREKLTEALGDQGQVFTTATAYRNAVDERLFRLGRQRYEALIGLLIQLRQPQLSRHLDEEHLSGALSEALRPPSPQMIADIAEAFRGLESDRLQLEGFREAHRAVSLFLREYSRYAQIAARRRARVLRTAHSAYEATMRRVREAERARADAEAAAAAATAALAEARRVEEAAEATVQTLRESPAMQDAQTLRRVRDQVHEADERVVLTTRDLALRQDAELRCQEENETAAARAERSGTDLLARAAAASQTATRIGVGPRHDAAIAPLGLPDVRAEGAPRDAMKVLRMLVDERRRAGVLLTDLARQVTEAQAQTDQRQATVEERRSRVDEALEKQAAAGASLEASETTLLDGYRSWAADVIELRPETPADLGPRISDWCRDPRGRSPVAVAAGHAAAIAREHLSVEKAAEQSQADALAARIAALDAERELLRSGEHQPPPPPPTRDPAWRKQAPGAPLWRLCEFVDGVDDGVQAGIEAALEAAGLLDAWVTPDGRVLEHGQHDVVLTSAAPALAGPTVSDVLRPAANRLEDAVSDQVVSDLLARIGLGSSNAQAWVDSSGRFRLGPLEGRFAKPAAEHIGEGAREAQRQRRLGELSVEIAALQELRSARMTAVDALRLREQAVASEEAAAPDDQLVRLAAAQLTTALQETADARGRLVEAETRLADAKRQLRGRVDARNSAAADLGLAAWTEDLPGLAEAIAVYRAEVSAFEPALTAHLEALRMADARSSAAATASAERERAAATVEDARTRHARLAAELAVLQESVGAGVEEILERLRLAQEAADRARSHVKSRDKEDRSALEARVHAVGDLDRASADLGSKERERDGAIQSLGRLATNGLLGVAVPGSPTEPIDASPTRAIETARTIEEALTRVEAGDAAWDRSSKGLLEHVQSVEQALISHGYQASATIDDQLIIVTVPFQGRPHTMAQFGEVIGAEILERQSLLGAREREIIENHLVGEVSLHLHELLHAGERWVLDMNRELEDRPTSTGMTLRFAWNLVDDGPEDSGLVEIRKRLMRAGGTWSPRDREEIGAFLHQRIEAMRAAKPAGTWQEHLAEALDYRRWHRFAIERQQEGVWRRLTRRTHGTGSGGEKAIALTIPQFAAAAAHYRSADPRAPRLIMLDEAFVGVDSDMRSKCMGLLSTFDLDFVMTSEREWGCYPTLPGLAIYQLATRPGIDAVGVTRFVWNGRERLHVDAAGPGAREPAGEAPPLG